MRIAVDVRTENHELAVGAEMHIRFQRPVAVMLHIHQFFRMQGISLCREKV